MCVDSHTLATLLCSGQKPVPFIPVFDENFQVWFKKGESALYELLLSTPSSHFPRYFTQTLSGNPRTSRQ